MAGSVHSGLLDAAGEAVLTSYSSQVPSAPLTTAVPLLPLAA